MLRLQKIEHMQTVGVFGVFASVDLYPVLLLLPDDVQKQHGSLILKAILILHFSYMSDVC